MITALDAVRRRLTPPGTGPRPHLSSVRSIAEPQSPARSAESQGKRVSVRLGVQPADVLTLRGFAFDDSAGSMIAQLEPILIAQTGEEIACTLDLPPTADVPRLCLVIEGTWPSGDVNGCEISFDVEPALDCPSEARRDPRL